MKEILIVKEADNKLLNAHDVFDHVQGVAIDHTKEHLLVLSLNTKNQVINVSIVSMGILDASLVHPREVFRQAILDGAKSIILAHNHPSGHLEPSLDDHVITRRLREAGNIIDIPVLDHIIFNKTEYHRIGEN
jgi:DNA repair protein RadC